MIELFTDGASRGNPGPGGYGVILRAGQHYKELSQGFRKTTNNRMELLPVIAGLEALKKEKQTVLVYSDSKYVVDEVENGWLQSWLKINFKGTKNADLWNRLDRIYKKHYVRFNWVKRTYAHAPPERCYELAVLAATAPS